MFLLGRNISYLLLYLLIHEGLPKYLKGKRYSRKQIYDHNRLKSSSAPKYCMQIDSSVKAHHRSCFLRPDTGPCRADILQWYFDVKAHRCYRFYWGGCQGNGNRFETLKECNDYCFLNGTVVKSLTHEIPNFCSLTFDYGSCFGYYIRWTWDNLTKHCKRVIYSGCGGNQNNFETQSECSLTCIVPPNNTLSHRDQQTTCIPIAAVHL